MMRRRSRPTAKLLIAAASCVALVVGLAGCGLISRMSGSSSDPMDGVLTAMGGNPQAAVEYLTPHGGSADDAARVEELMSHDDLGDNKWTDIWAKIAECTSSAYAGECVEGGAKGS